jgi:hypothetical protein
MFLENLAALAICRRGSEENSKMDLKYSSLYEYVDRVKIF